MRAKRALLEVWKSGVSRTARLVYYILLMVYSLRNGIIIRLFQDPPHSIDLTHIRFKANTRFRYVLDGSPNIRCYSLLGGFSCDCGL
ncbi:hypothetical protein Y032_0391g564 [Ancylostoma ceylanicum]|uniref:Uncharacterized protein n=1 Tax=Ancylostoma ceylanicum TaxID=53326 RepID=A0A016RS72_9BILA|nr:hypothetical protein Y032_0391g564 [Ancylostoma ceylanicum]